MHLLIIEDHEKLANNIKKYFEAEGAAVTVCFDGQEGFEKALLNDSDCIILDCNLPTLDGLTIAAALRRRGNETPIVMLTARTTSKDAIDGLEAGADDYVRKPFDLSELSARVNAVLRRPKSIASDIFTLGSITLNATSQQVFLDEKLIDLAPREFALLEYLFRHKGEVCSRPTLLEHVWGSRDDLLFSQTVDVHIAYIRKKLGKDCIRTVPQRGYMIPSEHV